MVGELRWPCWDAKAMEIVWPGEGEYTFANAARFRVRRQEYRPETDLTRFHLDVDESVPRIHRGPEGWEPDDTPLAPLRQGQFVNFSDDNCIPFPHTWRIQEVGEGFVDIRDFEIRRGDGGWVVYCPTRMIRPAQHAWQTTRSRTSP